MTRKEEREQFAAESVKGADKLYGYKYTIKDVECACLLGAEWADKTMLDKLDEAIEKLRRCLKNSNFGNSYDIDKLLEDFRKAME